MTQAQKEKIDFYLKYQRAFLSDFWRAGNSELGMSLRPHDCESGTWYEFTWLDKDEHRKQVGSMWHRLAWERLVKYYLDYYEPRQSPPDPP